MKVAHRHPIWSLIELHFDLPLSCMTEGTEIGNSIGEVIQCDVGRDGACWGEVLRVYIEMELHKPIPRGRTLNV